MRSRLALISIITLLVLAAAVFWWTRLMPHLAWNALEILPADTFYLFEIRNGSTFEDKLRTTALADLWREPEIQQLLGQPKKNLQISAPASLPTQWRVGAAFAALIPGVGKSPALLAGLETGRAPANATDFVATLARSLGLTFEPGQNPPRRHGSHVITSAILQNYPVEITIRQNFCLLASEPAALDQLLDRLDHPGRQPSLQSLPALRQASKLLPADWDSRMIWQPGNFFASQPSFIQTTGAALPSLIVAQTRVVGKNFQDSLWLPGVNLGQWPALSSAPAVETGRLLDLRLPLEAAIQAGSLPSLKLGPINNLEEIRLLLRRFSITATEWRAAFGSEMRLTALWPKKAGRPAFQLTCEVKDAALATGLFERVRKEFTDHRERWQKDPAGHEFILISEGEGQLYTPAATLQGGRLRILSNLGDLPLFDAPSPVIPPKNAAPDAGESARLAVPEVLDFHLDTALLVDRSYRAARPFLLMSLQFMPQTEGHFDLSHLPQVETLTRHLGPVDLRFRRATDGLLIESDGSLTIPQILGAGALGAAWLQR